MTKDQHIYGLKALAMAIASTVIAVLSSCDHKELCFDHDEHAFRCQLRVVPTYQQEWELCSAEGFNWSDYAYWQQSFGIHYDDLRPLLPSGLRIHDFCTNGPNDMINIEPMGETIRLRPGRHQLLFYNNDTEYIVFDDMYLCASAKATTRTRTRTSYKGNPFYSGSSEPTVNMPDMLYGNYNSNYTAEHTEAPTEMTITMHPLVFKYLVRYEFSKGQEYVALARGALSGMAAAVYLLGAGTAAEASTLLYDCSMMAWGAQALVTSFGVPDYPSPFYTSTRTPRSHALNLEVRLKNGLIRTFNFDVSDQINKQPQGGVIVVSGIEISDEDGNQSGSGFDVAVDGWGEFEDVALTLK